MCRNPLVVGVLDFLYSHRQPIQVVSRGLDFDIVICCTNTRYFALHFLSFLVINTKVPLKIWSLEMDSQQ